MGKFYISKTQKDFPGFHWFSLVSQFPETGNWETWKPVRQTTVGYYGFF
jgi:hypothetical protein